jgi:hypothetical protein
MFTLRQECPAEAVAEKWPTFHCAYAHCMGRDTRSVIDLWGDADLFCEKQFRANRRRAVSRRGHQG